MSRKELGSTWNDTINSFPKKLKFYKILDFILKKKTKKTQDYFYKEKIGNF